MSSFVSIMKYRICPFCISIMNDHQWLPVSTVSDLKHKYTMHFICVTNTSLKTQFAKGIFFSEFKNFNRHFFPNHIKRCKSVFLKSVHHDWMMVAVLYILKQCCDW